MKKAVMVALVAAVAAAVVAGWEGEREGERRVREVEWAKAVPVPVEKPVEAKEKAKEKAPRAVPVEPQIAAWAELGGLADQLDSRLVARGRVVLQDHGFKSSQVRELILQACKVPPTQTTKTLLAKIKYLIYQDKEFRRVCSCRMARGSCWGVLN